MASVSFTNEFRRNVRRLGRKYRNIRADLISLITELEAGLTPGDQIRGIGHTVYKVRVRNTDTRSGKSGGYRVIYYLPTDDETILITMYSKTEQGDISAEQVRRIIDAVS